MSFPDVAYCCFTDTRNIGDFALFEANRALFPHFRLFSGHERRESRVNLFGGGTLYPYCLRCGWYRKRPVNVALGIGVQDPRPCGTFGFLTRRAMRRWPFPIFAVRGYRSQAICARHGIAAEVSGDTALALTPPAECSNMTECVGISFVGEDMPRIGSPLAVYSAVLGTATRLLAEGRRIKIFPFCRDDLPAMTRLAQELKSRAPLIDFWAPPINSNLDVFLAELRQCDLVIGERLHACVLAAAMGIPFVSIGYKTKCLDFAGSIGLDRFVLDPGALTEEMLCSSVRAIDENREEVCGALRERVSFLRGRLHALAANISDLVLSGSRGATRQS